MKNVAKTLAVGILVTWCVRLTGSKMVEREVRTRGGIVRGYLKDGGYFAFLGIPYAKAMVGRDRFKAPEPPEPPAPWQHVFEATRRVRCPQPGLRGFTGTEDCLVVNVMVSETIVYWLRPVLVVVHGGDFLSGWGASKPPTGFIDTFVVVTFNYRLGALGFLCLGTADAPGNVGLKDQVAAMYWIHKNIDSFGGDPDDVTVYGMGSGAASVQMLLLSGLMTDLIHRVVLDSGSLLSPTMMTYAPYATAHQFAKSMMFRAGSAKDLAAFYRKMPLDNLVNISTSFLPCVENTFRRSSSLLDKDPIEILKSGRFDKVPMLVAYTHAQEADLVRTAPELFRSVPEYFEDILPNNLVFESTFARHRVADVVKAFYFGDNVAELSDRELSDNYVEYIDDIFMDYPVVKFAMLYASKSMTPVYVMKFAYKDAKYGDTYNVLKGNVTDKSVRERLYTLWKNFMTINDPTPLTTSLVPLIWQPMLSADENHQLPITRASWLIFHSSLAMSEGPSQRLSFWDHIYAKFYKLHVFDPLDLDENN